MLSDQFWGAGHFAPDSRHSSPVVVAATVGATAVFLVARTAIDDGLRVKAEPVPHKRR